MRARGSRPSTRSSRPATCKAIKDDLYQRVIPALHPDLIVAVNLGGYSQPGDYFPFEDPDGQRADSADLASTTSSVVTALRAGGRDVLLVEPMPIPSSPTRSSIRTSACRRRRSKRSAATRPILTTRLDLPVPQVAKQTNNVYSLDLDKQVCPLLPICDPVIGGQIVKMNPSHITAGSPRRSRPTSTPT